MTTKDTTQGQRILGSVFAKLSIDIKLFDTKKLKRKLRKWTTKEVCICYNNLKQDRSLEAMKTKQTLIIELKRRDKDTFYLWLYDCSNLNDPGQYFMLNKESQND